MVGIKKDEVGGRREKSDYCGRDKKKGWVGSTYCLKGARKLGKDEADVSFWGIWKEKK